MSKHGVRARIPHISVSSQTAKESWLLWIELVRSFSVNPLKEHIWCKCRHVLVHTIDVIFVESFYLTTSGDAKTNSVNVHVATQPNCRWQQMHRLYIFIFGGITLGFSVAWRDKFSSSRKSYTVAQTFTSDIWVRSRRTYMKNKIYW